MDQETNKKQSNGINKPKSLKPKFSFYWIYALLAVLIIGMQMMSWNNTTKDVGWGEVKKMLQSKHINKVILVNKEFVEIYIKPDTLKLAKYKEVRPSEKFGTTPGP